MSCCPVTAEPARGAAPSTGAVKKIGQTTVYVTGPATAKAGIIAYPDIFGLDSGRSKADADTLGRLGYSVVLVDLVDGDYLDPDSDWMSTLGDWLKKYTYDSHYSAHINDAVNYLKSEAQVERIASYGYCWGSWVGATKTASADPVMTGHVSFHPAWNVENLTKGDGAVDKLAESVQAPQLLLAAGDDPDFVKPQGSVHKILAARGGDIAAKSNVIEFPSENHGWVHRGDLENPATKKAVMEAWHAAVKFIQTVNPL
jgi:dienelactone hydrolase|uniref:Dienelactone hydrolase domain-containing protein n=1 Tax=Globisporangium ultimum (strain ATCC 200006 / CBS 805.95 / DAOM BR144) TaxID=431595 RepID=K3WJQ8_GLOUD